MKKALVFLVAFVLVSAVTGSETLSQEMDVDLAGKGSAEAMIGDLIVMRPLGIAATVVGAALFVVSTPFSLTGMNTGESFEKLVAEPVQYTFARSLGDVEY
jgi:hypothetical protein